MTATADRHRLRCFLRLETDLELRARLTKARPGLGVAISMYYGYALDAFAESLGMPRRIVECES